MSREKNEGSGLRAVAEALERDLARYEQLVVGLQRERLESEKNLRRAAQTLNSVAQVGVQLGEHLTELLTAIMTVRTQQEALTASVQASAERIRERGAALNALLESWKALGEHAAEVNREVQRMPNEEGGANGSGDVFAQLDPRLTQLADEAQRFTETATAEQFADLARQGEGLRAQLLAVRNKLRLARRSSSE